MGSRAKPRVLLAGEQTLVLEAVRHCLESELGIEGCVTNIVRRREALGFDPEAAVVHLSVSRGEGLDQLRRVREAAPAVRVVVLAEDDDPQLVAEAFRLGASGWVGGSSPIADLSAAVQAALAGRPLPSRFAAPGGPAAPPRSAVRARPRKPLRPRERQVLRLLAKGKVMREIAAELGITSRTVAFHKYRMMDSLGVRSTAELLRFAVTEEMAADLAVDGTPTGWDC